ncbi:beta-N-acetylglucosaminidase domain-containing protein [Ammoniphilus sp. 3BR4]|uniref:protein O-GlcNAcase n=1 Tax=Ammoniphilus sp. 3BR4 TaxID=3158265 RepID=UPI003464F8B3
MKHVYPRPAKVEEGQSIGAIATIQYFDKQGWWKSWITEHHVSFREGEVVVEVYTEKIPPYPHFQWEKQYLTLAEGYFLEVRKVSEKKAAVWIYAPSARGYFYAFQTWRQLLQSPLNEGWILDQPRMKRRGIVEGYYGSPWSLEERKRALSILSSQKMNTYVYAPKNDRYHRDKWDSLYPPEELGQLSSLAYDCQKYHVDMIFAVSPGLSIQYTSNEHANLLFDKYKQVYDIGVRHFGLFFDDIPLSLFHESDRAAFPSLTDAHIHFIQKVFAKLKQLDEGNSLVVCPTQYFGKGDEEYIRRLGQEVPEEVDILWTGRTICSPEIDIREARIFYEQTGHQPLFWDNYPVNDANMRDEMHIGPFLNRHPLLYLHSTGLIANVMEYPEASLIPLITIAHYLWNPAAYQPSESFEFAVKSIVGDSLAHPFIHISDCINQSVLSPLPGSKLLTKWLEHQRKWQQDPQSHQSFKRIVEEYQEQAQQLLHLENVKLRNEMLPWIQKVMEDFQFLLSVLEAKSPEEAERMIEETYQNQVKALGFFPYLISREFIDQIKK